MDQAEAPSQAAGAPSPAATHSARAAATGENRGTYTEPVTGQVTGRTISRPGSCGSSASTARPRAIRALSSLRSRSRRASWLSTINSFLASLAKTYLEDRTPVQVTTKETRYGVDLLEVKTEAQAVREPPDPPPTPGEIPF